MLCIGIIGNFSGHLSGAENVQEDTLPNGIFVIHCDHNETLSSGDVARYPPAGTRVDIEPEFVLRCKVSYAKDGKVSALMATQITIGNDFTIRELEGSQKISERKAWGEKSKGINQTWWDVLRLSPANYGNNLKLVSYVERNDIMHLATPVVDCTELKVFYCHLMAWMTDRINHQQDDGMYDAILPILKAQGYPDELVLYTGAPNYTKWGDENFVQKGDKVHIAAFNSDFVSEQTVKEMFTHNKSVNNDELLSFSQLVV
ncbi:DUF5718 family protein [Vibrio tapetis subsp. quintayensis]|uniref:DUF5718 family protein n=1 Tax=Vibrio tapetis TaxID=52443 RepID=UPI0025B2C522|nr:DUF5718 family protein [Vibrio tapetis]MDN3683018.1 DUF5718 family protein [Vibrio tapetis subsp. quintayensis]